MPKKTKTLKNTEIDSIKHADDTRKNIPTEELRGFVTDKDLQPQKLLYPRNPDLDPQLVWRGKDEQDGVDLTVEAPPIYIQEKIHPQALIEDIRAQSRKELPQFDLFADFSRMSFEQLIEFYQHEQQWSNRMILGDSLQVMASLAEKEGLKGQVQMIYIDPPYGIKFGSNWQVSTRKRDVKDGKLEDCTRQPEQIKAFRDTWELGIHSYLAYLRDRLTVARALLSESGSIFVQIGDENVHLVRCLLDEVFGSENFVRQIVYRTSAPLGSKYIPTIFDNVLWYAKNIDSLKFHRIFTPKTIQDDTYYNTLDLPDGICRKLTDYEQRGEIDLPKQARVFANITLVAAGPNPNCVFPVEYSGKIYNPTGGRGWKTNELGLLRLKLVNRLYVTSTVLRYKFYLEDYPLKELTNIWTDMAGASDKVYVVQTNVDVITRCLLMTTDPGDLVLDPTCGSGTTAYVAEHWGRRWITCDTSRVALALARTRLMAAKYPYYLLADSHAGLEKQAQLTGKPQKSDIKPRNNIKLGFVYKTVPHITLKSIANNAEIDIIHDKWQTQLEPIRQQLNTLLNENWQEWEIPREANPNWDNTAKDLLIKWWDLRQQRQRAIDDSIAKNADTETLYDQPYEDNKRIRVTGPFTVESLSPHRLLPTDETPPHETPSEQILDFSTMILDNLRKAGVQNTVKAERLYFERLEPFAGKWLQAEGEYIENGQTKRVAVAIGPEHNTIGSSYIKEAAKEARLGLGFDLLLICGFAFDATVTEEVKHYGNLTVLPVKMNPDLAIGTLKETNTANLFIVFGEPDVKLIENGDKIQVELLGVDIYDPTTGQIRSNSTNDIACWFIDTDYNGEAFFVRHAYFTGADEPYEKLKKVLRAEVDENAWNALYSTKSRLFDKPPTGKIAVKVINHYGDEVIKVFEV